jgi:hypothetical protein
MLALRILYPLVVLALLAGCAARDPAPSRPFLFYHDSFSFSNELVWEYRFDDNTGKTTTAKREPPPTYTHHCFVVARAAKQFLNHARFDPELPKGTDAEYRAMIRWVVRHSPRRVSDPKNKITIPGYADLREFSAAKEALLKAECGGAWRSYVQRGHWRMVFPFNKRHQERTAEELLNAVEENRAPLVHLVRFPRLSINHAILIYDGSHSQDDITFSVYDPNNPHVPATLTFDKRTRRFEFPRTPYFIGGRVDVYEIYYHWLY